MCGTNTGELVVFDSQNHFKASRYQLGSFSIKKVSATENRVAVLTNSNLIKIYFKNNFTMALTCENKNDDVISEILFLESQTTSQVRNCSIIHV